MSLKDFVPAGLLVATVAAGMTMAQNQVQISGSGRSLDPVKSELTAATPAAAGTRAAFVDSDAVVLTRTENGAYAANLLLYNAHCSTETVGLAVQLFDRDGEPLVVSTRVNLQPVDGPGKDATFVQDASGRWSIPSGAYALARMQVAAAASGGAVSTRTVAQEVWTALTSAAADRGGWAGHLPAKGAVVLTRYTPRTAGTPPDSCAIAGTVPASTRRPLMLKPPLPPALDTGLLVGALLLAALTTLAAGAIIFASSRLFLRGRMGEVSFAFGSSWGANVAVGAGLLTAITGGTMLTDDQYSNSRTMYLVLASLFAALVPLGAALYALLRRPVPVGAGVESQGYVSIYLLSSGLVLWGAFGQLLLIGMMFRELSLAHIMSPDAAALLMWLPRVLIALLVIYGVMNAWTTVSAVSERAAPGQAPTARPPAPMV